MTSPPLHVKAFFILLISGLILVTIGLIYLGTYADRHVIWDCSHMSRVAKTPYGYYAFQTRYCANPLSEWQTVVTQDSLGKLSSLCKGN